MSSNRKGLLIRTDESGKKLEFSYVGDPPLRIGADTKIFFELDLFTDHGNWNDGNPRLIGRIVIGALGLLPPYGEEEERKASERILRIISQFEEEERRGISDTTSLSIRAELEFVEYSRTGVLDHFLKGEALYKRLAAAGSQKHIELMKSWNSEREQRIRRGLEYDE